MSSEILVYGVIELLRASEEHNSKTVADVVSQLDPERKGIASSIGTPYSGWPAPTMAFARLFKKTRDNQEGEALVASFEAILYAMKAFSAKLHIEDEEGLLDRTITYVYYPDHWSREIK
jgi:hypothetical protein